MVSKKALEDFKKIWKKKFNEDIPDDFALAQAVNLLTLMNAVYRPVKKEWLEEFEKNHPGHQNQ